MRKDLTSETSRRLHRRRGRVLIAASAAVLIVGSALSMGIAVAWRHDRKDAAAKRFRADEQLLESNVRATVSTYVHALQVTRGFFGADPAATRPQFLAFAGSLDFKDSTPGLLALESIRADAASATTGGPDIAYPIDMVAPRSAVIGLLWRDLAYDPSVRKALPLVARRGGVMMMPPRVDVFRHVRMLLVGSVSQDPGLPARWVGASIDPAIFGTQAIGEAPPETRQPHALRRAPRSRRVPSRPERASGGRALPRSGRVQGCERRLRPSVRRPGALRDVAEARSGGSSG